MRPSATLSLLLALATPFGSGCTDAQLAEAPAAAAGPATTLSLSGQFTGTPDPTAYPVRILFVVDISGSMAESNPAPPGCGGVCLTHRAQAIYDTLQKYPPSDSVAYSVIWFSNACILTVNSTTTLPGFTNDPGGVITVLPQLAAINVKGFKNWQNHLLNLSKWIESRKNTSRIQMIPDLLKIIHPYWHKSIQNKQR